MNSNSQINSLFSTSHFGTMFRLKLPGAKMTSLEDNSVCQDQKPHLSFWIQLHLQTVKEFFACWQRNLHSAVHRTC